MPIPVSPRRRSRQEFESDNEGSDSQGTITPARGASRSKKPRLSAQTDRISPFNARILTNGNHGPRNGLTSETLRAKPSKQKHQPGSIVRVTLENFVTYTAVDFHPGPRLNMVIGPNGTGKSTLVCAICLGLGWGPQHLGRAKEVSEFVKHGSQEATIELELAKDGVRFKQNIVIRCMIKREGNKSVFSVNGKPQSKKAVVELARSLSIQIDNLCQFLPQDKVVEFAAMTPIELLRSTQRAVASQEMIDIHENLKDYRRKQKELQIRVDADQATLENLQGRQRLQEADVDRMREREEVVKRVAMLEQARPVPEYRVARKGYEEAKAKRREAINELKNLQTEVEPSLHAVNAKQQYKERVGAVMTDRKAGVSKAEAHADKVEREFNSMFDKSKELDTAATAEREGAKKHKGEIARFQQAIARVQKQIDDPPPEFDVAAYNEKIREKQRALDECERQIRQLQGQQEASTDRGRDKNRSIQDAERSLAQLESQAGKQSRKLEKASSDTFKLWQWVQEHRAEFEKPVFGPPIVECAVKDPAYVDPIESLFKRSILLSFTTQTKNDFKKLSDVAHDNFGLSDVNIRTISVDLNHFRPPIGPDEMQRFGFDGWALDYLQGPEPVLAMICAELKIHETGVSLVDSPERNKLLEQSPISFWVTKTTAYKISRRREYNAQSTSSSNIRRAEIWTDQPVDLTAKRELQERIRDLEEEVKSLQEGNKAMDVRIHGHREAYRSHMAEKKALEQEKAAKQQAAGEYKGLPAKLAQQEAKLAAAQEHVAGVRERLNEIAAQQDGIAMERARLALLFADAVEALRIAHNSLHEAEIMLIEATSDYDILIERNRSVKDLLEEKNRDVETLATETDSFQKKAKEMYKRTIDIFSGDDGLTLKEFIQTLSPDQTPAELQSEIDSEKARLELMHEGNGGVIKEFETRKKKIDSTSSRLDECKEGLRELDATITELRNQWEPELDRLVGKISDSFSYNMQQISCAGEVGIHKDDDFEQWAIQIRVKFRDSEPLTPLDSHRQSGGERAVSTIFYLMSLQSLTKSPFRVVDEINQGMDPRNERLVHKRMVGIACGGSGRASSTTRPTSDPTTSPDSDDENNHNNVNNNKNNNSTENEVEEEEEGSQYFLITPKLLPGLDYVRGMQVLCIASGEYMPEERGRVGFQEAVERKRGRGGGNAGGWGVAAAVG